jgi:acyl transferase domain-containing protein
MHVYAGADRAAVLRALERNEPGEKGPARLVLVASGAEELAALATRARAALAGGQGVRDAAAGIFYRDRPLQGELGFVGASAVATYSGMGSHLLWAFHDLIDEMARACPVFPEVARWYEPNLTREVTVFEKLAGAAMLTAFHGAICRRVLGLRPKAILGLSSGEMDVLFAAGVCGYESTARHLKQVRDSGLLTRELGGSFEAVRGAWGCKGPEEVDWTFWRVATPVARVRVALAGETRVHLAIIHTPGDIVLAGARADCLRVLERLGWPAAHEAADYRVAFHVPEARRAEAALRSSCTLPLKELPGLRFYASAWGDRRPLRPHAFTDAYLAQATGVVDFPRMILKAWTEGVRIFVEVGPHSLCSHWIDQVLGDREHLAVALDCRRVPSLRQAALAAAELLAAGVAVDYRAFNARMSSCRDRAAPARTPAAQE